MGTVSSAQSRADRHLTNAATYLAKAEAARKEADRLFAASDAHSARFAGGQPILNGHSSAPSAHRARNRSHNAGFRAVEKLREETGWRRRADAALRAAERSQDPNVIQRRLRRIDQELAQIARRLHQIGATEQGETEPGGYVEGLRERRAELELRQAESRAELDRTGVKVWGPDDFAPGDFALSRGVLWEVEKVNPRSLRVGSISGSPARGVYRLADNPYPWTDLLHYEDVQGRASAERVAQAGK